MPLMAAPFLELFFVFQFTTCRDEEEEEEEEEEGDDDDDNDDSNDNKNNIRTILNISTVMWSSRVCRIGMLWESQDARPQVLELEISDHPRLYTFN